MMLIRIRRVAGRLLPEWGGPALVVVVWVGLLVVIAHASSPAATARPVTGQTESNQDIVKSSAPLQEQDEVMRRILRRVDSIDRRVSRLERLVGEREEAE